MDLNSLCRQAYEVFLGPPDGAGERWAPLDTDARAAVSVCQGIRTDVTIPPVEADLDRVRMSVVMSDLTSVFLMGGSKVVICPINDPKSVGCNKVVIPKCMTPPTSLIPGNFAHSGQPSVKLSYLHAAGDELPRFVEQFGALAESGRILLRPLPQIMVWKNSTQAKFLPVDLNGPAGLWACQHARRQLSVPIETRPFEAGQVDLLSTIMLPYIKGVPLGTLNKILDDEHDYVQDLRISIKEVMKSADGDHKKLREVINDKVRPATDKVARKFKTIANTHSLRVGAISAVVAVLGLYTLTQSGLAAMLSILVTGGVGGNALLRELTDQLKARAEAKEMPFYLLWRISKEKPA
jgi:hypothetical protein